MIVASAPGYAQGVIDPIEEIGKVALETDTWFHVDACVGGIHLSMMRRMGMEVPAFDFTVPGAEESLRFGHSLAQVAERIQHGVVGLHRHLRNGRNVQNELLDGCLCHASQADQDKKGKKKSFH